MTPAEQLVADLRRLAAECRAAALPHAGTTTPHGVRQHAQAEAYDRAATMAERTLGGER